MDVVNYYNNDAYYLGFIRKTVEGFAQYKTLNWEKHANAAIFLRE